jgi:hypothetical protein
MTSSRLAGTTAGDATYHGSRRAWCLAAACIAALAVLSGCGGSSGTTSTRATVSSPQVSATSSSTANTTPAVAAPASATAHTVGTTSGGITATLRAGTHQPKVEAPWPIQFTVIRAGRAVTASVSYEYLFGGQVVAHRSHYTFSGHFSDVFKWPSTAVGYPLTFRAVIVAAGVTIDLDYSVKVSG